MTKNVEKLAYAVLEKAEIRRPPIPVEALVEQLGVKLSFQPYDGDVSGMLFRDSRRKIIGVNSIHAPTRQRFTIAHEIGHLLLHEGREIIVDKLVRVNLRDRRSSLATDAEEIEANGFAATLLMPEPMLKAEVERRLSRRLPISEDRLIEELAETFKVSQQAMEYRLTNLGIRTPR